MPLVDYELGMGSPSEVTPSGVSPRHLYGGDFLTFLQGYFIDSVVNVSKIARFFPRIQTFTTGLVTF